MDFIEENISDSGIIQVINVLELLKFINFKAWSTLFSCTLSQVRCLQPACVISIMVSNFYFLNCRTGSSWLCCIAGNNVSFFSEQKRAGCKSKQDGY